MGRIYEYHVDDNINKYNESKRVEHEFKSGMLDPSRPVAQHERTKGVKKMVGKKAIMNKYMKNVIKSLKLNKKNIYI